MCNLLLLLIYVFALKYVHKMNKFCHSKAENVSERIGKKHPVFQ